MRELSVENVSHWYGSTQALNSVSFDVREAELVALLGPSGCGKTTLLRMIAGFVPTSVGRITLNGVEIGKLPPYNRNLGMVFQSYALFPHMSVEQNVAFGLQMRRVPKAEQEKRVAEALRLVRLSEYADRYPRQLSGGQQQRVAIARSLVIQPDAFLLDEPLSNLDAQLRYSVGQEIRRLQKQLGLTTVFVTHDQNEAIALSDRLIILRNGQVVQAGTAAELYARPRNTFVASFLGQANLIPGTVPENGLFRAAAGRSLACDTRGAASGAAVQLCVRPEHVRINDDRGDSKNVFEGIVRSTIYFGAQTEIILDVPGVSEELLVQLQNKELHSPPPAVGQTCSVYLPEHNIFVVQDD